MAREDEVKLIAYRLWEEEGCCHGRDVEHWLKAEMIWADQTQSAQAGEMAAPAKPKASSAKKTTGKKKSRR